MSVLGSRVSWLLSAQTFLVSGSAVAIANAITSESTGVWILTDVISDNDLIDRLHFGSPME